VNQQRAGVHVSGSEQDTGLSPRLDDYTGFWVLDV